MGFPFQAEEGVQPSRQPSQEDGKQNSGQGISSEKRTRDACKRAQQHHAFHAQEDDAAPLGNGSAQRAQHDGNRKLQSQA